MALAVTYYGPANWHTTTGTARNTTGVAWGAGDIIVVSGFTEDNAYSLTAPTNANLTFAAAITPGNTANEGKAYLWTATAASSQTAQTIATTIGTSGKMGGLAVRVVSGGPTGTTGATTNYTEQTAGNGIGLTVAAGDVAIVDLVDWNATNPPGKTPLAGSGTGTERFDNGDASGTYSVWGADWVGTAAGTFQFGPNNYTSLKVNQVGIVVQAPTATATAPPPRRRRHHLIGR